MNVTEIWSDFALFETVALEWFGGTGSGASQLRKKILYHDEANRMDVCMDFPSSNVALEFSFEPSQFLDDETGTFYC